MLNQRIIVAVALLLGLHAISAQAADDKFVGDWALTLPNGSAGWLGVEQHDGKLTGSMMWQAGSVLPVKSIKEDSDRLEFVRSGGGKIVAERSGDHLNLTVSGRRGERKFTGELQPLIPPAPDLTTVKFGEPIQLFDGHDLTGWRLTDPKADNGWSAKDGLLVNEQNEQGKQYGNLRTDREFEDFNLTLETKLAEGGNSGVFIHGIYEVQVADTYGRKPDPHNMGAVYSRITPSESAEKPPGEWQMLEITFVKRHATVILNGKKIIDNQPVRGCTGGALFSDVTRPGPIYLQGDHTGIEYRNIVIRPVESSK